MRLGARLAASPFEVSVNRVKLMRPLHDRPDQLDVDAHVVVDDLVPHTRDPPPRNARRRIAHLGWEVLDRLADAPEASDDRVLQMPALAEPPETDAPA